MMILKKVKLLVALCISVTAFGQSDTLIPSSPKLHYFRVNMGPKLEQYVVNGNSNVTSIPHLDVGAGLYIGRRFTENIYAEVGLIKNDYSARLEITSQNMAGEELKSFSSQLYPTFSSVQVGLLGGYRLPLSEKWTIYGQGGFHLFLNKKLTRTGSQFFKEPARNESGSYEEDIEVIAFSNDFEPGNIIFRGDVGVYRQISKSLSLDFSVSGRFSNLPLNEFKIEYSSFSNSTKQQAVVANKGVALNLIFGIKYQINKYKSS
ncbi:MAG: hypothetical protein COA58_06355 [Bacteroidetes bacterium]|nr:MAG: hypothetical protein COA58_06355 [Bacteroidota bacterium]